MLYLAWRATERPQSLTPGRVYQYLLASSGEAVLCKKAPGMTMQVEQFPAVQSIDEAAKRMNQRLRRLTDQSGMSLADDLCGLFEALPYQLVDLATDCMDRAPAGFEALPGRTQATAEFVRRCRAAGDERDQFEQAVQAEAAITPVDERPEVLGPEQGEQFIRPNGELYMPRLLGEHADVSVLRRFRSEAINVMLMGPAGSGKTAMAEGAFGSELVTVHCHGDMTVAQLVGSHLPSDDGTFPYFDGPLAVAAIEGRPLLLDEVNKLPHEVLSVLHSITDGRGVLHRDDRPDDPVIHVKEGFFVIATLNPDDMGSTMLPEALHSRFPVQIDVDVDFDAAAEMGVDDAFITFARNITTLNQGGANGYSISGVPDEQLWVPQMRELLNTKKITDAGLGRVFAARALLKMCPYPEQVERLRTELAKAIGVTDANVSTLSLGARFT